MSLIGKWFGKPAVAVAFLAAAVIAVYADTLDNPFAFDDNLNIVDNAKIRDLSRFWPPAGNRWLGDLSFSLNYRSHGLVVTGYHLVNLAIHLSATVIVFVLMRLMFRTPLLHAWSSAPGNRDLAAGMSFLTAALFGVHPAQTQAVTYIIQRYTSLATLFYILSVALYLGARLRIEQGWSPRAITLYVLALASAVLAMKTKEIAFTLPFALCLCEAVFFRQGEQAAGARLRFRIKLLIPFLLTLLIIPAGVLSFSGRFGETIASIPRATNASFDISRHDYLLTQFSVILTYLRLFFLPVNQSFDYLYPATKSLTDAPFLLAAAIHLLIVASGICALVKREAASPLARLAGFGIVWFYLCISVESSVIPISDLIFEHRMYLPIMGLLITTISGLGMLLGARQWHPRVAAGSCGMICVIILLLGVAAYERNTVWNDEFSLWQDVVSKNPSHARGHSMIGIIYKQRGEIDKAIGAFHEAIRAQPDYAEAHVNLGSAYVIKGMLDEGLAEFITALGFHSLDKIDTASLYINIAYYHIRKGSPEKALQYLRLARDLVPENGAVEYFFAMAYDMMGNSASAREHRARAHQLNPEKY